MLLNNNPHFCGFYISLNARSLNLDIPKIFISDPDISDKLREIALKVNI
jgi:hypothetical protein